MNVTWRTNYQKIPRVQKIIQIQRNKNPSCVPWNITYLFLSSLPIVCSDMEIQLRKCLVFRLYQNRHLLPQWSYSFPQTTTIRCSSSNLPIFLFTQVLPNLWECVVCMAVYISLEGKWRMKTLMRKMYQHFSLQFIRLILGLQFTDIQETLKAVSANRSLNTVQLS